MQDEYTRRREEAISQRDPESQEPPISDDQLLYQAVGGHDPKGRVYGFSSQAEQYFSSHHASSSQGPQYRPEETEQLRRDCARLEAEMLRQAQENSQLRQSYDAVTQEMARQQRETQERFQRLEELLTRAQGAGGFPYHQQPPPPPPHLVRA